MARQANVVLFNRSRSDSSASSRARRAQPSTRLSYTEETSRSPKRDYAGRPRNDADEAREERVAYSKRPSAREERRRQRNASRAERLFAKQVAADDSQSASQEGESSPRAAVYEGKMGASHRKSARMQRSSSAGSASAKLSPAGWFDGVSITSRTLKIATGVLCAVLFCTFLYVPAQHYYQAQREHDRLAAEYSMLEDRNDALDVQNDILASDAGMEDAVRQKYGYVVAGEQTAVVTGLSDSATSLRSDGIEANVLSSTVKAPEEWYTPLLDAFFGVE